jgi:hypothetical protein
LQNSLHPAPVLQRLSDTLSLRQARLTVVGERGPLDCAALRQRFHVRHDWRCRWRRCNRSCEPSSPYSCCASSRVHSLDGVNHGNSVIGRLSLVICIMPYMLIHVLRNAVLFFFIRFVFPRGETVDRCVERNMFRREAQALVVESCCSLRAHTVRARDFSCQIDVCLIQISTSSRPQIVQDLKCGEPLLPGCKSLPRRSWSPSPLHLVSSQAVPCQPRGSPRHVYYTCSGEEKLAISAARASQ